MLRLQTLSGALPLGTAIKIHGHGDAHRHLTPRGRMAVANGWRERIVRFELTVEVVYAFAERKNGKIEKRLAQLPSELFRCHFEFTNTFNRMNDRVCPFDTCCATKQNEMGRMVHIAQTNKQRMILRIYGDGLLWPCNVSWIMISDYQLDVTHFSVVRTDWSPSTSTCMMDDAHDFSRNSHRASQWRLLSFNEQ